MFLRALACFACAAFSISGVATAQTNTPLKEKEISGSFGKEIPVIITSNDTNVGALANKAFGAHGAYKITNQATNKIQLTKNSDTSITLVCEMPNAGKRATQNIVGVDWRDTTLRACDAAVTITGESQKLRPFFLGKLAFVSDRTGKKEIYVSDLFLNSVRPVTNLNSISNTPHWTRDGKEVLFTTYVNNNFTDIYAVNTSTGKLREVIVGVRGTTSGAVMNPLSGTLAFSSSARGNMDVYTTTSGQKEAKAIVKTDDVDTDPAWSADGLRLAFVSGPNGRPGVYTVSSSGGATVRIPTGYNYATEPAWNPVDITKIAFTFQTGRTFGIGVVDTASRDTTAVTKNGNFQHASWCADGRHIVATRESGKSYSLVLIDTESGKTTALSGPQMANCTEADYYFSKN
ncbi:MAG: hypothetical protein LBV12_04170 [Puniceicoccales bacterium]|jgi:TolB protein|nr:hypothetical protein [Puniceicoccales bacterium]